MFVNLGQIDAKLIRLLKYMYVFIFIYNNFVCNNQYKKAAIREELNPHVRCMYHVLLIFMSSFT